LPARSTWNIFITRAGGYIGGSIAAALLADGHRVRGLTRGSETAERLRAMGIEPVLGTLDDGDVLTREGNQLAGRRQPDGIRVALRHHARGQVPTQRGPEVRQAFAPPSRPPLSQPSASSTALRAPALLPLTPSKWMLGSANSASSTPQVNAPWAPPPCRARFRRGAGLRQAFHHLASTPRPADSVGAPVRASRRLNTVLSFIASPRRQAQGAEVGEYWVFPMQIRDGHRSHCVAQGWTRTKGGLSGPSGRESASLT
jgi:hypothetical protein